MRFVRTTTVAVLLVLAVSFLLGLVARSGKVQELADAVEAAILSRIPGYVLLKGVAGRLDPDKTSDLVPVIVSFDETCRLGLEVDRLDDDRRVVYFPGAPNAWSGVIQIVPTGRIETLDVPAASIMDHAEQLGKATSRLFVQESQGSAQ